MWYHELCNWFHNESMILDRLRLNDNIIKTLVNVPYGIRTILLELISCGDKINPVVIYDWL